MSMFQDVKEFHGFFGHSVGRHPKFLTEERMKNRLKWQDEERREFDEAWAAKDLTQCADAIADQIYFLLGHAVEMGLPMDQIWELVHKANMSKAHYYRHNVDCPCFVMQEEPQRCDCGAVQYKEDGKTDKPEGWKAPDDEIRFLVTR